MDNKPNYWSVLPADVRYDKELKANEKILYSEITSLMNKDGYCYASNKYFSELLCVRSNLPLVFSKRLIYIKLKTREPIEKDDGAMGHFKLQAKKKIIERKKQRKN